MTNLLLGLDLSKGEDEFIFAKIFESSLFSSPLNSNLIIFDKGVLLKWQKTKYREVENYTYHDNNLKYSIIFKGVSLYDMISNTNTQKLNDSCILSYIKKGELIGCNRKINRLTRD